MVDLVALSQTPDSEKMNSQISLIQSELSLQKQDH